MIDTKLWLCGECFEKVINGSEEQLTLFLRRWMYQHGFTVIYKKSECDRCILVKSVFDEKGDTAT